LNPRVLITGADGLIGSVLMQELGGRYRLSGLDRRRRAFGRRSQDMTRLRSVASAFEDQEVVIDLAANANSETGWEEIYRNNLRATFNAFEASRRGGVRRIVFASSNHVTEMYERDEPYASIVAGRYELVDRSTIPLIRSDAAIRPDGAYAVGKALGEALGRMYADSYGLSVICLRIGTVNAQNRPSRARHYATFLSRGDLVRLVNAAIDAPTDLRYGIFYGVSNNTWRFWAIDDAFDSMGFEPEDDAEAWRAETVKPRP
jgi:nucleoside-diphosphate-sugar epimerase